MLSRPPSAETGVHDHVHVVPWYDMHLVLAFAFEELCAALKVFFSLVPCLLPSSSRRVQYSENE